MNNLNLSDVPINKKVINNTGYDVKFDLRDICEQVKVELSNNESLSLTVKTSDALRLLYKRAEQLGLIVEDDGNIPPNPNIKHTVTLINNNDCVNYIKYIFDNETINKRVIKETLNKNTQKTFEIPEGEYSIYLEGPNHYVEGQEEPLITVKLLVNEKSENAVYDFGVEELVFDNKTKEYVCVIMDLDKDYYRSFTVRNGGQNGTFISNDIDHTIKLTLDDNDSYSFTLDDNDSYSFTLPKHKNQTTYTIEITEDMFK